MLRLSQRGAHRCTDGALVLCLLEVFHRRAAEDAWPTIGATAALGIVLASGLARDAASVAGVEEAWPDGPLDRGTPPPRPRVEPLELARVSTPLLGLVLVRRLLGAAVSRLPLPRRTA